MRRILWILLWLFGLPALACVAVYFHVLDTGFSTSIMYADTGIGRDPAKPDTITYLEKPDRVTLVLARGESESALFTDSNWREEVSIEISKPHNVGRIEFGAPEVRVGYRFSQPMGAFWGIGTGGIRGHFDISSIDYGELKARYVIQIDAYAARLMEGHRNRERVLRGRATFRLEPRPTGRSLGDVWPKT